ncbi:hypothetical protein D7B24_009175 [Verticillium nonalfalfae]|uniref:F-box domain-containing protein n=1 Tax=Verticillium nonalfalfae TaxID=1051616 RepID=A0A3M9YK15_9PEZI|nr:uncharacterized protein D7B24_009175 [Verticillium nonalfalfae]RNJ60146.1 hypothetical protein D7B24_009175 [Verticillium nonalfalfae]
MTLILRAGPAPSPPPSTSCPTSSSHPTRASPPPQPTPPQDPSTTQDDGESKHPPSPEDPPPPPPTLPTLPPELQSLITAHLSYPDALSLKHTNRHFFQTTDTGVRLKVAWLLERRDQRLACPSCGRGCDLASDLRFCRGGVGRVIRRRRMHGECESRAGLGCVVFGTGRCERRRRRGGRRLSLGGMRAWAFLVPVLAVLWAFLRGVSCGAS